MVNRPEGDSDSPTKQILTASTAFVPVAAAYFILYLFDVGYCAFYGIPSDFVVPNVTQEIGVFLSLTVALFSVFQLVPDVMLLRNLKHEQIVSLRNTFYFAGTVTALSAPVLSSNAFSIVTIFVYVFVLYRAKRPSIARTGVTTISVWHDLIGDKLLVDLFTLVMLSSIAYATGYRQASNTTSFYVNGNWAIIRRNGDSLVEKPITVITQSGQPQWIRVGDEIRLQQIDKEPLTFSRTVWAEVHLAGWTWEKKPWWMWFFKMH